MTMPALNVEALLAEASRLYAASASDEKGQAIAARNNLQRATLLTQMAQVVTDRATAANDAVLKGLRDDLNAQLAKTVTLRTASITTSTLLSLGGSRDFPITWPDGGFKDANYDVQWIPCSSMNGATYTVKNGTKTAAGLTVTITATGLALATSSTLGVAAIRYA